MLGEVLPDPVRGRAHDAEVNRVGLGLVPGAKLWVRGRVGGSLTTSQGMPNSLHFCLQA